MSANSDVRRVLLASASVFVSALAAFPAAAQTPPSSNPATASIDTVADDQTIIVTGSRIPRAGFDTPQPALVIDSRQLEYRGYTNIGDALQSLPSFGVPGNNGVGTQAGGFGAGQTFVNFFGLGSERTLVLVNGRRFVSSNTASIFGPTGGGGGEVDLNTISPKLVDRIETIAVGGAPIYGADAIAGTVNIILKRDYQGIDIDAQYGIASRGDARDYRIQLLAGQNFAGGRGNITFSGEYNQSAGLLATDRKLSAQQRYFTTPADPNSPYANELIFNRRLPSISEYGIPLVSDFIPLSANQAAGFGGYQPSVQNAAGQPLRFDTSGNLIPIDFGKETGDLLTSSGGNGFSLAPVTNLLTPTKRYLGTILTSYQISDNVRFFGEAWYSRSEGTELRAQPVYNSAIFGNAGDPDGNLIIPLSNPYLSSAARSAIQQAIASNPNADSPDQDYFYLGRANTDLVSGLGRSTVELYRFVAGFDGDFNIGSHKIHYELVGNYGRSKTKGFSRELNEQNFLNAINSTKDGAGNIICAPGYTNSAIASLSSTCAPINPFGQQISQAARDYVTTIARPVSVNTQKVITASMSGDILTLPGGNVGFALGYEHREEHARFDPGAFFAGAPDDDPTTDSNGDGDPTNDRTSYGRSVPIDAISGGYKTDEFFGELRIPVIAPDMNIPLIHAFSLNGAIRYVHNSLSGGDPTYTMGSEWQPIRDITFRGNYTRSIRAPSITNLFNPTSGIFTTADDPCDTRFIAGGPNPSQRAANCAAAGIGPGFQSNIVGATARGTLSGNTNLTNERADSYTFGAVIRPRFIPGLTISADWISIKLKNAIVELDATQVMQACYDSGGYPNTFCQQFTRDAEHQVTFIKTGYYNAASYEFRGIVAQADYTVSTPFLGADSKINIGLNYQYVDKLQQEVGLGSLTTLRGSIGYSKNKGTATVTYINDAFAWQWQAQYYGPAQIDPDAAPNTYNYPSVGAVTFFNTTVAFNVNKTFKMQLIVDNVFDKKPPFPAPGGGGTITYFDGILGRYFKMGASVRF